MAYARTADVKALLAKAPGAIVNNVLRGAARAAAEVVAAEAKDRCASQEVSASIRVSTGASDGKIIAKVQTKGPGAYIAPWLEYGTAPHFISVDESQRGGMSVRKVNDKVAEGSLVIGGHFVGTTVHHPGARPHPFLRPALDIKHDEAIAAAQAYITSRLTKAGLSAPAQADDE